MGNEESAERPDAIPEMRPWLEAGWIFRDGDARTIARQVSRATRCAAPAHDE